MANEEEFKGTDSISHLTKNQTGGRWDIIEERSEVNSPEELRMLVYNRVWSEIVHPVFNLIPNFHFSGKVSKDRQGRKENVDMAHGINAEQKGYYTGLPIVAEAITSQSLDNEGPIRRRLKRL